MSYIGKCKHGWSLDLCRICYPKDGIWLTTIVHPEGNPVPDNHKFNPESLETIEIDIPYVRVFREVMIGDYMLRFYPSDTGWMCGISNEMMDAIEETK